MREFNYISEVRTSGYKEELVWEYKKWIQLFLSIKKNGYRIRCELVVDEDDGVRRLIIRYLYITNGDAFLHENMDRYGTISYRDYREMIEGMHDGF